MDDATIAVNEVKRWGGSFRSSLSLEGNNKGETP